MYRSKEDRRNRDRTDKGTWFRKAGATAIIMVPATPESQLAKGIRKVLLQHKGPRGTVTKVVERPVMAIHSDISSYNPFPTEVYGRTKCPYLQSGQPCLDKCAKEMQK